MPDARGIPATFREHHSRKNKRWDGSPASHLTQGGRFHGGQRDSFWWARSTVAVRLTAAQLLMQLLLNEAIYRTIIVELLPQTQKFLWIVTADIKDLHVPKGRRFVPLLEILSDLIETGVSVRLMHAKEPGPRFREDFDKYPNLVSSELFERILCPRIHTKAIIMDGRQAFIGSANLTGAGLGAKGTHKRNFEAGFLTTDAGHLREMMDWIDQLYLGEFCLKCQRRSVCPDPIA